MKVLKILVALLVLSQRKSDATDPLTIVSFERRTAISAYEISRNVLATLDTTQFAEYGDAIINSVQDKRYQILNRFKPLYLDIQQAERLHKQRTALGIFNRLKPSELDETFKSIAEINHMYKRLLRYESINYWFEKSTLISYSNWTIGSPPDNMRIINAMIFNDNLLGKVALRYEELNKSCTTSLSAQQFIYIVYSTFALWELKAYLVMEVGYTMLRIFEQETSDVTEELEHFDFLLRLKNSEQKLKEIMKNADRSVWRCDPETYKPNVTYDQVTRLLQGYIENEVDMDEDASCKNSCDDFKTAVNRGCTNGFCAEQSKCSGDLHDCKFIATDMSVCLAPSTDHRRYEYIKTEDGAMLGKHKTCDTKKVESWHRWVFWQCSYCFCLCDEQGPKSDRYFNLRETLSDVQENKVVTGLRFVKRNRVFHLQIQQAKMLSNGHVNDSSLEWKPIDAYSLQDPKVTNGLDYHTLNYSSRGLDLDELTKPTQSSMVITGVRFRLLGSHLNLMARFSKFDFETGRLLKPDVNSEWHSNDSDNREQIPMDDLDLPNRANNSLPLMKPNQFLQFVNSGTSKDAAQSTIPFIDIQDVVSDPAVPLAGVGIYYKTTPGFGGFIAPKIITYDYSPYV